ncbi:hypothetical protein BEWA_019820 [Theileria equi strain WA]|uniref:DNA polymerase II subunit 2 n=1 Tax=Theileria equi strain WA TaxID=1537102 RepID=L0AVT2_THEEQ|nr:hypothetical protein BEWA_019820 [Theileria equi strain WA]AFZ79136.1 hypothetical protein BEWA_019820 [Theileria equi strain WA]|eukprot:XP_004828802.1 hypothetical protein BEWA_019820 [Theileria equi strain WA]
MDNLFDELEDGVPDDYTEEVELPPNVDKSTNFGKNSSLISNLIKYGINPEVAGRFADVNGEILTQITPNKYTLYLEDDFMVDSRIWYYLISKLSDVTSPESGKINISSILEGLQSFIIFEEQNKFISDVEKRFGPDFHVLHKDGIHIYHAINDIPKIVFSINKRKFIKQFVQDSDDTYTIEDVCNIRYELLFERSRGFNYNAWFNNAPNISIKLLPVDSVSMSSKDTQLLIGNLGHTKDGELCLQGTLIELSIVISENCKIANGIYCDGQVVIIYGTMKVYENIFHVDGILHPPITLKNELSSLDFFGGKLDNNTLAIYRDYTSFSSFRGINTNWIIISNLYLDKTNTIETLEHLFDSYIEMYPQQGLPVGFIFMGDFNSLGFNFEYHHSWIDQNDKNTKHVSNTTEFYARGFETLYKLLIKPKYLMILSACYLVFVPGPNDATLCRRKLPRQPLLNYCINRFKERVEAARPESKGRIVMATNPCRIRHWGRQMIFYRQELLTQLLWEAIITSSNTLSMDTSENLIDMLTGTIVGQSHLFPNKPGTSTILQHDSSLLLHPLPDFICLSDTTAPAFIRIHGHNNNCLIANCDANFSQSRNIVSYDSTSNKAQVFSI